VLDGGVVVLDAVAGVQQPVQIVSYLTGVNEDKLPQAQFTQVIYWLPARPQGPVVDKAILLVEQRTLSLSVDESSQEVALRWDAEFEVGRKAGKVSLRGAEDHGLGLCLQDSFRGSARFDSSAVQPSSGSGAKQNVSARWTSVLGKVEGQDVTLALFAQPGNASALASFFTMSDPIAFLSATQDLAKKPLEYSSRSRFQLHYLLTMYPEGKSREFIQQRSARWQPNRR
jgi:hypothetical protein